MMFACVHSAVVDTFNEKGSETEQQTESASASFAIPMDGLTAAAHSKRVMSISFVVIKIVCVHACACA